MILVRLMNQQRMVSAFVFLVKQNFQDICIIEKIF